jgi:hypothetical protein
MVDAEQQMTQGFILVPAEGAVRPAEVCSWHYIARHRGACSGASTSKAGEEVWLPSPCESGLKMSWESERVSARCAVSS